MKIPLLLIALSFTHLASAENIVFPAESGIINVKEAYGAKGDGRTDDTDALQKAVFETKGKLKTLYFPNGTYLVNRTLFVGGKTFSREPVPSMPHSSDRFINLQGQSEAGTILKLKDGAEGFNDPEKPTHLFSMYDGKGTGDAMHAYVRNMTFDIGSGNPGASGLRFLSNNTGGIFNVTIRSSDPAKAGSIGLDLRQGQQGPELIRDVTIDGFDTGVQTNDTFAIVFERLTLRDQRKIGMKMPFGRVTVRDLKSENKCPVIHADKHTHFVLIGAELNGGAPSATAITALGPKIFFRDIRSEGYGILVQYLEEKLMEPTLSEWTPGGGIGLFNTKPATLRLPIKETPALPWEEDFSKWVVLDDSEEDDTDSLQKQIDEAAAAGKTTLCFKPGQGDYMITGPLRVHGSLNRIVGMESLVDVRDSKGRFKSGKPVFTFEQLKGDIFKIERFFLLGGWKCPPHGIMFGNPEGKTIVVEAVNHRGSTKTVSKNGEWFLDDVSPGRSGTLLIGSGEKVWARQFNPESPAAPMIEVDGGQLWLLALKTEGRATHLHAKNGAKVEILGGVSYQSWGGQKFDPPMFIIEDSAVSLCVTTFNSKDPFSTIVKETANGVTETLSKKDKRMSLFSLYRSAIQPPR